MPRPTTKQELIHRIQEEYNKLQSLLTDLSDGEIINKKVTTNWTTKDVLAHLTEWSQMVMSWHHQGQKGETPAMPAEGYTWRQIPALNQYIYEKHQADALSKVKQNFKASYQKILELAQSLSEDELFERSHFSWTRENNVATYVISGSCSHYDWAYKRIKRGLRPKIKLAKNGS
jgi:hypothetical protein